MIRIYVMRIHRIHRLLEGHRRAKAKARARLKRSKKPTVLFSAVEEQKLVDFSQDNEILYN